MRSRIPVKKYVMNPELPWKDRYKQLETHHEEETSALITIIGRLEAELDDLRASKPVIEPPTPDKPFYTLGPAREDTGLDWVDFFVNGERFQRRSTGGNDISYEQLVDMAFPKRTSREL
jgi:hypothetical protein